LQQNAKTIADVLSSGRIAEQTMSSDSSLLADLRQDRHVAELEAELKKLATTVEQMLLQAPTEVSRVTAAVSHINFWPIVLLVT